MYNANASNGDLPFAELKAIGGELEKIRTLIMGMEARLDAVLLSYEGSQMAPRIEALRLGAAAGSAIVAGASASPIETGATDEPDLQQGQMPDEPLASAEQALEAATDHQDFDNSDKDEDAGHSVERDVLPGCDLGAQDMPDRDDNPAIAAAAEPTSEISAIDPDDVCEHASPSDASISEPAENSLLELQQVGNPPSCDDVVADAHDDWRDPEMQAVDTETVAVAAVGVEVGNDQRTSDRADNVEENDLDTEEEMLELALPVEAAAGEGENVEQRDDPAVMLDAANPQLDGATSDEQPSTLPGVAVDCDLTNSEILISADTVSNAAIESETQELAPAAADEEPWTNGQSPAGDNGAAATDADAEPLAAGEPLDDAAACSGQATPAGDTLKAPAEIRAHQKRRSRYTAVATTFTLVGAACVATLTGVLLVRPELMLDSLKLMIG